MQQNAFCNKHVGLFKYIAVINFSESSQKKTINTGSCYENLSNLVQLRGYQMAYSNHPNQKLHRAALPNLIDCEE